MSGSRVQFAEDVRTFDEMYRDSWVLPYRDGGGVGRDGETQSPPGGSPSRGPGILSGRPLLLGWEGRTSTALTPDLSSRRKDFGELPTIPYPSPVTDFVPDMDFEEGEWYRGVPSRAHGCSRTETTRSRTG